MAVNRPRNNRHHARTCGMSRREMLERCSLGFGTIALAGVIADEARADTADSTGSSMTPRGPHFAPQVKHVILCYMAGGVSQVDSFDPKPRLTKEHGQPPPMKVEKTMFNQNGTLLKSPWEFKQYGESGIPISDLFPHIGSCADELAVIRSMTAKFTAHAQANVFFHTGQPFNGLPSLGAWTTYGLGSETKELPGYVVLGGGGIPVGGINMFGNGFLPAVHQGSVIYPGRPEPLNNIQPKEPDSIQRKRLSFIDDIDRGFLEAVDHHAPVEAAIRNYEMAYRMQAAVPELVDLSGETEATKKLYGLDSDIPQKQQYAQQCLLARRLVERGVRFVELTVRHTKDVATNIGSPWDQHNKLKEGHEVNAFQVDQPIAGLIKDLKARGLLDETLIVWSGEFGRTPFVQRIDGRDHNPFGFSMWLAGGGIKGGTIHGATDEYGYHAVENILTLHDLHATILHLLGLDHERLTYHFGGRDFRLTDVHGKVIQEVLA